MTDATHTWQVGVEEQVRIFLYIIVTNLSKRKVGECFHWLVRSAYVTVFE